MKLKRIYIEITNICNLSCDFCTPHQRPLAFMTASQFQYIIQQIKPYTRFIYLHLKGEPLLHPELATLLQICHTNQITVNLTTNGTLLEQQQQLLLHSPALRQINISLHSIDQQPHPIQEKYLQSVFDFSKQASELNTIYTSLRLWNQQNGVFDDTAQQVIAQLQHFFQQPELPSFLATPTKSFTLCSNVFLSLDVQFQWPSLLQKKIGTHGTCYGLRTHIGILVDGTVVPCCLDHQGVTSLGNLFHIPLSEILTSDHFISMREGFQQRKIIAPLCQHCSYRTRF